MKNKIKSDINKMFENNFKWIFELISTPCLQNSPEMNCIVYKYSSFVSLSRLFSHLKMASQLLRDYLLSLQNFMRGKIYDLLLIEVLIEKQNVNVLLLPFHV